MHLGCILVLLGVMLSLQSAAQTDEQVAAEFERRAHTFGAMTLPYRLFVPNAYDPSGAYPLMLTLHGAGERGGDNDIHIQKHALATSWAHPANQLRHPAFVVAPQAPAGGSWTDLAYDPVRGFLFLDPMRDEMATVMNLLEALEAEFSIDPDRIYVTGLSMGGIGAWDLIRRFPIRFAAAIPMSGIGQASAASRIVRIPIWAFHGESDEIVTVLGSRSMISALTTLGHRAVFTHCNLMNQCAVMSDCSVREEVINRMPLIYTEYENQGHNVWRESYENTNLIEWTFLQNRSNHRNPVDRFRVTFEVDVTVARPSLPPAGTVGMVGDVWPLEPNRLFAGCPVIDDDILSMDVAFPIGETPSQVEYRFAYSSDTRLDLAGTESELRTVALTHAEQRLPIVFWNDAGGRAPDAATDPVPVIGGTARTSTTLSWSAGDIAGRWDVQVALDDSFAAPLAQATGLGERIFQVQGLDSLTVYHWRVRGVNGISPGPWSGPWSFLTVGGRPLLVSPPDGSQQPRELQLEWRSYPGVTAYTVYLSTEPGFGSFSTYRPGNVTSVPVGSLDDLTTYYWKVIASTTQGPTKWSDAWSFTVDAALSAEDDKPSGPLRFVIGELYPNPGAGVITVSYDVPVRGWSELRVYDLVGREVAIISSAREPGRYSVRWNTSSLAPGAYLVTLVSRGAVMAGQIALVIR